jgi:hypothetical protein
VSEKAGKLQDNSGKNQGKNKEPADSAAGPDKIGPGLLQNLLDEVAPVLEIIFWRCLEETGGQQT